MSALALWARRLWPYAALLACMAFVIALPRACAPGGPGDVELTHRATVAAEQVVTARDGTFRHDTVERRVAVTRYRTARDTLRLTDTVQVRVALARADTLIVRDSAALASAVALIAGHVAVEDALRGELAAAGPPRTLLVAEALYDPIRQLPAAALEASVRLSSRVALVARGEQRFQPGESPRALVGVRVTF